ncbi:MAG TPA: hypothetical protein VIL20_00195 [Sandaracinaceae bacterium]
MRFDRGIGARRVAIGAALAIGSAALSGAIVLGTAEAVSTERFVLDDAGSLGAGELIRTVVHSDGRVTIGPELARVALPDDVPLVYSAVRARDGTIFLGTGNDGRVFRVRGDRAELFAETRQLLVAALAIGEGGALYAGTLPEGRIYRIDERGAVAELVRPEQAEHVWALVYDPGRRTLFAATGPEGRVYAIDRQGRATVWWDATAPHVMSLALGDDGALYAGTSEDAIVARITGPQRVEIVHDFPGNEITALAFRDGTLVVAANELPDPPNVTKATATDRSSTGARAPRPAPGKGRIFRIGRDGRAEEIYARDRGHVTSLSFTRDGAIAAGIGDDGLVVRVSPDRTWATWMDVDERQVRGVWFDGDAPFFVTGDGAALYRVTDAQPRDAIWESKVLDARFPARWGQLTWRGEGQLAFQTRSGNTERPDETWSEWSSELTSPGPIRSPAARFLQIRARYQRDPDAVLRAVTAYFLPQNQRAYVRDVRLEGENDAATKRMRAERQDYVPSPSVVYKIAWTVDNPDGDRLRYRLRYRAEDQSVWRDMLRESEVHTETHYSWNTSAVPDGWYVVRVEASDELDNAPALALRSSADSEPIRVDNHAPRIEQLRTNGARLTGRAVDALGPIARLEYAIDGGEWIALFPVDDLFDTAEERFEIDLSSLSPGTHIVAVRATDASGNVGSGEAQIRR